MKSLLFGEGGQIDQEFREDACYFLRWLDFDRGETIDAERIGVALHEQHATDLKSSSHPPYFEQTDDYELIILRNVDNKSETIEPKTRSIAFLIHGDSIISIHDEDDRTLDNVYSRMSRNRKRQPKNLLSLLHLLIDEITDGFLELREPLNYQVSDWQFRLLDPNDPFDDWQVIMQARSSLRRLNTNLGLQRDVLTIWQEQTRYDFDASLTVKFNDIQEHLSRIERLTDSIRADLDSLTQVYFASVGQKTNANVQFLAVVSAIFLPLNLIAGIFGMNFDKVPLLDHPLGAYIAVGLMVGLSVAMLWWFRKNKWF